MSSAATDQFFRFSTLQVVLVEGSNAQTTLIKQHLDKIGISAPHIFQTGAEALTHIAHHSTDLILGAMHLPDMTGTELVSKLREAPRESTYPFF